MLKIDAEKLAFNLLWDYYVIILFILARHNDGSVLDGKKDMIRNYGYQEIGCP